MFSSLSGGITSKVDEATSTKDDAPPVYLMDSIADTVKGSPESAEGAADHIVKRLNNRSPVVRWKALRLVRHMCNKGCSHFQRTFQQRHASAIRDQAHYQGEKDPFKGDALNQRVRDAAKETIDALYNATPVSSSYTTQSRGRIEGFGSSNAPPPSSGSHGGFGGGSSVPTASSGSYGPPAGASGSRMVGFGSDGRTHVMQPAGPSPPTDLASAATYAMNMASNYLKSGNSGGGAPRPPSAHTADNSGYTSFVSSSSQRRSGGNRHGSHGHGASGNGSGRRSGAPAGRVMGTEESLVDDICTPGGLRMAPDASDLRKFVENTSSMDGLKIGELLIAKMGSPAWQVQLRALYALEAVLQHGSSQACGEVAVMFQSDPSPVTRGLSSAQPSVQDKSQACLKLLLADDDPLLASAAAGGAMPAPTAAPEPAAAPALVDLLGDDLGEPAAPAGAADMPAAPTAPAASSGLDFLGEELAGASVPAVAPAAAPADPFAAPPPQHQASFGEFVTAAGGAAGAGAPVARPALSDMFSSMNVGGLGAATVAPVMGGGGAVDAGGGSMGMGMNTAPAPPRAAGGMGPAKGGAPMKAGVAAQPASKDPFADLI